MIRIDLQLEGFLCFLEDMRVSESSLAGPRVKPVGEEEFAIEVGGQHLRLTAGHAARSLRSRPFAGEAVEQGRGETGRLRVTA